MKTRGTAVVAALVFTALTACTTTTPEQKAQEETVSTYLNVVSKDLKTLPSVTCAVAVLPDGGTPNGAQSDIIAVDLKVDLQPGDPRVDEVLEQVGQAVWSTPLPVYSLEVTVFGGLLLGPDGKGTLEREDPLNNDELTALYGPRQPLPATLPPIQDPGPPQC